MIVALAIIVYLFGNGVMYAVCERQQAPEKEIPYAMVLWPIYAVFFLVCFAGRWVVDRFYTRRERQTDPGMGGGWRNP